MARQEPLTEREVREAARPDRTAPPASAARRGRKSWGIVERVPEPAASAGADPAGDRLPAVGDHWQWFGRAIAERKVARGRPRSSPVVEPKAGRPPRAAAADDPERCASCAVAARLARVVRRRSSRLFTGRSGSCRTGAARARAALELLGRGRRVATILRLFDLLGGLDEGDDAELVDGASRLSPRPRVARRSDVGGARDRPDCGAAAGSRTRSDRSATGVAAALLPARAATPCYNPAARGDRPTRTGDDPGARSGRLTDAQRPEEPSPP